MAEATYWIGIGDIHDDLATLGRLAALPGVSGAAGILVSGDLTIRGDEPQARLVVEALRRIGPVILAQIGNMDRAGVDAYLTREGVNIHASGRVTPEGVGIFGVGWSTPTPFGTPSEASEERIAAWLTEAQATVAGCSRLLLVCHTPPYGTATDVLGGGVHVGSPAVRHFIEQVQPDVCLTGHIHEARAEDVIGRTQIVNPGALSAGGFARIVHDGQRLTASLSSL
jgi:Icc-related predicted phosphoesterase